MLINLKRLRDEASISQRTLAEAIGVSQQSVNKYENHNIEPDIETMIRIADYFDTSVDYLIGHTDKRNLHMDPNASGLDAEEVKLVKQYRSLTKRQKDAINTVMNSYLV